MNFISKINLQAVQSKLTETHDEYDRFMEHPYGSRGCISNIQAKNDYELKMEALAGTINDIMAEAYTGKKAEYKVYREWLCDEDNNIVFRTLEYWAEYFNISPVELHYQAWWSNSTNKPISLEKLGGYGLQHDEYEAFKHTIWFVANADLDTPKLRQKLY